nr:helix-turn-helix domain-containing protein [Desulfitobacterium hafniense]
IVKLSDDNERDVTQVVVPIQALNQLKAYLTVTEVHRQLQELDFISLENAATVVCLEMVKQFAVQQVEQRFKNDLIRDIISGHIDPKTAMERAGLLDWDLTKQYAAIVFQLNNVDSFLRENSRGKTNLALQGAKTEIASIISNQMKFHVKNHIIGSKGDSIIVFWPVKSSDEGFMELVKHLGREIQAQIQKRFSNIGIAIGVGTIASKVEELPRSYREAHDAILFGQMIHGQEVIISYSELGIFRLLCGVSDKSSLLSFVPGPLKKLQEYDNENQSDLLKTLEVFFDCNGNASKAAKELFVHYKTILYRLERIKELTNLDLEKTNNRLELEIGLKILKLIG